MYRPLAKIISLQYIMKQECYFVNLTLKLFINIALCLDMKYNMRLFDRILTYINRIVNGNKFV